MDAAYFHIDPSRSAAAAAKLFGETAPDTVLVCDRYSAYKKLARELAGRVVLAWCWSHQRRNFIDCAAGQVELTQWCETWLGDIAGIYRLNKKRLSHYKPGLEQQDEAFEAAQRALETEIERLFATATQQLSARHKTAREAKPLRSLLNHREGLSVFLQRPEVPMDNNFAYSVNGISKIIPETGLFRNRPGNRPFARNRVQNAGIITSCSGTSGPCLRVRTFSSASPRGWFWPLPAP